MAELFHLPLEVAVACAGNELSHFERRSAMNLCMRLRFMTLVVMGPVCYMGIISLVGQALMFSVQFMMQTKHLLNIVQSNVICCIFVCVV